MLQLDKILHFLVSLVLVVVLNLLIGLFWSVIIVALIGLLKEIYDGRFFCWKDLLADFVGILFAIILII